MYCINVTSNVLYILRLDHVFLRVGKALRDKQKSLHDATDAHRRQMRLWRDVEALLIAKLAAAGISGVAPSDQLQSSTAKPTAPAASSSRSRGGKRGADRLVIE